MTTTFDKKKIQAFAEEFAKDIKTQSDLKSFTDALMKATVETALNAELTHHLGYEKHSEAGKGTGNSRNGKTKKTVKGTHGELELEVPRDRDSTFKPVLVEKK